MGVGFIHRTAGSSRGMWDRGSKGWDQGSEGRDLGSQPRDQGSQAMGSGSAVFWGIRDHSPGIKDHKPRDRDQQCFKGSGITALGLRITSHGIGISSFLGDQGSGYSIFVRPGTKICHSFGIKDQKFGYKNGISNEKACPKDFCQRLCSSRKYPYSPHGRSLKIFSGREGGVVFKAKRLEEKCEAKLEFPGGEGAKKNLPWGKYK